CVKFWFLYPTVSRPVKPEGNRLPLRMEAKTASIAGLARLGPQSSMHEKSFFHLATLYYLEKVLGSTSWFIYTDYVEVLKEILSTGFNATKFFRKTEFTYIQKKQAEEALFNALEAIVSENGEQAVKAQRLLTNFGEIVNSIKALRFWNGLRIREEKANTQIAQIILQEKEEQNACQIRSNMLNEHIQVLERKRRNADGYEEGLSTPPTKIRTINSLPCDKEDFSSDSDSEIIPVSLTNIFETSVELERISDQTAESDAPRTPLTNENASAEVQDLIAKMENVDHHLFEYRIVNLSEKSLVDPVNKVFSDDDKKRMRKFWEEMVPSAKEKQNTLRRPRWEKSIKPLIDKYVLAVEVKPESVFDDCVQLPSKIFFEIPFEGEFDLKKHYDMLWVQDIYRRFTLLFALSFNMLRDANTLEIAYRESF
ncbi:3788_t:CDS:2, partial [Ambispora leptoticha]